MPKTAMANRITLQTPQWVDPINEYHRLAERHQTVEPRQDDERRKARAKNRPERRFIALRKLVSTLKKSHALSRIDLPSAERELQQLGLEKIQNDFADLLTGLDLSTTAGEQIVHLVCDQSTRFQWDQHAPAAQLDHPLYANLTTGLKVIGLSASAIRIPLIDQSCRDLVERCQQKRLMASHNNLLLTVKSSAAESRPEGLLIDLSIALGVLEIDDAGRRAFVYQRTDHSFALYADKQINLEI